ncbi:MAG TPA: TPM domain-containing protein [Polyangiaceae bacterium]|jgi:uncharacterized protein
MVRTPAPGFAALAALLGSVLLLVAPPAWAKFTPPPKPAGHVVTTVGWLAPADIRTFDQECEVFHSQTGNVLYVLLVPVLKDETIQDVTNEVFQAWKPGDLPKENGLLLVIAPNYPTGERKARLVAGKDVPITPAQAKDVLLSTIEPRLNSDDVRGAVAAGIADLTQTLGSGAGRDAGAAKDAGAGASAPAGAPASAPSGGGSGVGAWILGLAIAAAAVIFGVRMLGAKKG